MRLLPLCATDHVPVPVKAVVSTENLLALKPVMPLVVWMMGNDWAVSVKSG